MERKIGFSTGVMFHNYYAMSFDIVNIACDIGCTALELNIHEAPKHVDSLLGLGDDDIMFRQYLSRVNNLDYLSCHLPCNICYRYESSNVERILQNVIVFSGMTKLVKYVVLHPDLVVDWEIFDDFSIPIAIENMDNRKNTFRTLQELRDFFQKYPQFKLVFDVQHWIVNNNDISAIPDIITEFSDKLVGVHLSGVGQSNKYHVPVSRANHRELVESLCDLPAYIPIILEGVCTDIDEMEHEFDYVTNILT